MQRLAAVEEAKVLFTIAKDWSILKWLTEKKRVRAIADKATAALDERKRQVKLTWSESLRNAYAELTAPTDDSADPFAAAELEFLRHQSGSIPEVVRQTARRVKDADDAAEKARLTAEKTFDDAERRLSASLARRGAEEAIQSYELRYKAIAEAEAAKNVGQ